MNVDDEDEDEDEDDEDDEEDAADEKGSLSLLFVCNSVPCDLWVRMVSISCVSEGTWWVVVEQGRCNFLEYKRGGSLIFPLFLGLGIPTVVVSAFK